MSIELAISNLQTAQKLHRIVKQAEKDFDTNVLAAIDKQLNDTKKNVRRIVVKLEAPATSYVRAISNSASAACRGKIFKKFNRTYLFKQIETNGKTVQIYFDAVPSQKPVKKTTNTKPTTGSNAAKKEKPVKQTTPKAKAPVASKERVAAGWTEKSLRNKKQREAYAKYSKLPAKTVTKLFDETKATNAPRMGNKTQRLVYMIHIGGKCVQALEAALV